MHAHTCSKLRVIFVTAAIRWQYLLGAGKVSCWLCTKVDLCDEMRWWLRHSAPTLLRQSRPVHCTVARPSEDRLALQRVRLFARVCLSDELWLCSESVRMCPSQCLLDGIVGWLLVPTMNHMRRVAHSPQILLVRRATVWPHALPPTTRLVALLLGCWALA
jgi:hypothetical protein